ncbi:metalloprotease [Coniochaeta sp. 2T2.1]|nr:metalloprotease [Coniochaeta sp. 2T2.1]
MGELVDDYPKTCVTDALISPEDLSESNIVGTPNGPSRLALRKDAFWPNGKKLKVRFLNGTPFLQDKVKYYAQTWEKYANIDFQFVPSGDAEIRISFKWNGDGGSWSYLGTDNLHIAKDKPTMNYGWFDENTRDEEFSRTVTHEFGHALGCIHEHQSPAGSIRWNEARVIADSKKSNGWDEAQTRQQIINKYQAAQTTNSEFDRNSIMCYFFPAEWTTDGQGTPTNRVLSDKDKEFIGKMYPFQTRNSGKFRIQETREWYPPVALNSRVIQFSPAYLEAPKLVLGLNEVDMDCKANIRIKVHTDAIEKRSGQDFKLNIDSWSDSSLYGGGATWLEFAASENDFQVGEFDTLTQRTIDQVPQADAQGVRRDVKTFTFPPGTYSQPPNVVVWLKALDLAKGANWRVRALARNVTADKFELSIESWSDTRLFSAAASWVAYPKGKEGVYSGVVNSLDYRTWYPPSQDNGGKVRFPKAYDKEPKVFAAINYLDMDSARNLRVKGFVDTVDNGGFAWHANTWGDSVLYSGGLNWISFG